jgi:putative flippase GtrA
MRPIFSESLLRGHRARVLRFAVLGAASTGCYIGIVLLGTSILHIPPLLMNTIGYVAVLPINFILQRNFTFIAYSPITKQVQRFLIVHSFNIMTSSLVYVIAHLVNAPTLVAIIGVCIIVPACQFLSLDLWVFRRENRDAFSADARSRPGLRSY